MKWVYINNSSSQENFELRDNDKILAGISFNKQTRFVRLVYGQGKRMFTFEKKGLIKPGKIIRNEYGIKLGRMEEIKPGAGKGIVVLNGKKYFFVFDKDKSGDLVLYDERMQKNLLTCSFNAINPGMNKTKSLLDTKISSLLLLLCWINFQPNNTTVKEVMR